MGSIPITVPFYLWFFKIIFNKLINLVAKLSRNRIGDKLAAINTHSVIQK